MQAAAEEAKRKAAEAEKAKQAAAAAAAEEKLKQAEAEKAKEAAAAAAAEEAKRKQEEAEKAKQAAAAAALEEEKRKQAEAEKAKEDAAAAAAAEVQRKQEEAKRKQDEAEKAKQAAAAAALEEEKRKQAEAEKAKEDAAAAAAAEVKRKQEEAEKAKEDAAAAAAAEEKRKQAEAEQAKLAAAAAAAKAKAMDETCQHEAADVADYVKARSPDALNAMRSRAACPKTLAAIDAGLRDVQAQECASERDQVRDLGTDLDALKKAVAGFACDAVAAAARGRIAQLEQEAARVAKACDDAKYEVDNKIDGFAAGAREKLEKYLMRTECPVALADAQQKINDIDERVSNAQDQLKKLGCYKSEPASKRFDGETQAAITRFERGAKMSVVDGTRLSPDFMQTLAGYTGEDACKFASLPPPVAPVHPEAPRETPREAPRPRVERPEPPQVEPRKPLRPKRQEPSPESAPAPHRYAAPPRPAPAPAAPATAAGGAKPPIFIPN